MTVNVYGISLKRWLGDLVLLSSVYYDPGEEMSIVSRKRGDHQMTLLLEQELLPILTAMTLTRHLCKVVSDR